MVDIIAAIATVFIQMSLASRAPNLSSCMPLSLSLALFTFFLFLLYSLETFLLLFQRGFWKGSPLWPLPMNRKWRRGSPGGKQRKCGGLLCYVAPLSLSFYSIHARSKQSKNFGTVGHARRLRLIQAPGLRRCPRVLLIKLAAFHAFYGG